MNWHRPTPTARATPRWLADAPAAAAFLGALLWSGFVASVGFTHALSDWYGWRQAQTALPVLFMLRGGPWIDYQVPIFGPPWAFPHEFPLYQWLVAGLVAASGLPLELAGRCVSLAFFYLGVGMGALLLAELELPRRGRLLVLALWMLSPLYLFWSRTVMVESTALALCLAFLAFYGRFLKRGRAADALAALAAGCLGAAVKPPTIVPCAALAAAWLLLSRADAGKRRAVRLGGVLVLLPPLAGWAWQHHADALKLRNAFASPLSSGQLLHDWVFSTSRFSPEVLRSVWDRALPYAFGQPWVFVAAAAAVLVAGRRRGLFALASAAFLAHFVAFAPLDSTQEYYWYGAGVYLVAAVGIAVLALLECDDGRRRLAWPLALLAAASCLHGQVTRMLPLQRENAYERPAWIVRLARAVAANTRPDDVVVAFGLDWNPELPYYAGRRALMWPGWSDPRAGSADVERALASLDGQPVAAVVNCRHLADEQTIARFRERWGLAPSHAFDGRCTLDVRPRGPAQGESPPARRP